MLSAGDKAVGVRKRDRYIAYACNRCRAAKVRCNGKLPCSYCVARDPASCHYRNPRAIHEMEQQVQQKPQDQPKATQSSRTASIQTPSVSGAGHVEYESLKTLLQHQNHKLDAILQRVSNVEGAQRLRQRGEDRPFGNTSLGCAEPLPVIQSSTSAFFCIHIIDNNLKALEEPVQSTLPTEDCKPSSPSSFSILHDQIVDEIVADIGEWDNTKAGVRAYSPGTAFHNAPVRPLDDFDSAEITRLLQKYHDVVGMMYPVANVGRMLDLVGDAEAVNYRNTASTKGRTLHLKRGEEAIIEMMMAIALAAENENGSDLIQSLHDNVLPDAQHMVWNTEIDLQGLVLLALVSLFYYHTHKWRLAWRFLGNVTRIILELGLNRRIVLDRSFPQAEMHTQALNVIWSVFVLEQLLRHALGLSLTTQDLALDSSFPKPVNAPYLEGMIQYIRIGSHASDAIAYDRHAAQGISQDFPEVYTYFQYRLSEWRKNIKSEFQFNAHDERVEKWNRHLEMTLHLRANVLQICVARFILFGKGIQAMPSAEIWSTCIDAATATAYMLADIDANPSQFQYIRSESNYFLISALGILLLAISQSTTLAMQEQPLSPETFYKARQSAILCLNLLRTRANSSRPSKHLWKRVRSLASRLNLLNSLDSLSPDNSKESTGTERSEPVDEIIDNTPLVMTGETPLMGYQSNLEVGSSAMAEISASRNIYSPIGMTLDSTYMLNQLLADFETNFHQ